MHEFCEYLHYTGVPEADETMIAVDDDPTMEGIDRAQVIAISILDGCMGASKAGLDQQIDGLTNQANILQESITEQEEQISAL